MTFNFFLLYFVLSVTVISLAKLYFSWRRSLSGIALGTATMVMSMLGITIFGTQVEIPTFLIVWIAEGDLLIAFERSEPSWPAIIITVVVSIISTSLVAAIGIFGIKNYKGPVRSSEWDAKNADDNEKFPLLGR